MPAMQSPIRSAKLSEIFAPEAIIIGLEQRTKPLVIAEVVHRLVDLGQISAENEQALVEAILTRERAGSTALWHSMAMPNLRSSLTERFVGVLAIDPRGVDFDGIGGELVKVLFLLIAPLESRAECFDVLGKIAAVGKNKSLVLQLAGCRNASEVQQVLQSLEG